MPEVAIIGAGELGGAVAHTLATREAAGTVRLIDEHARVAEGKALDIMQAAPIERFATRLAGSSDVSMAATADVVVVADRFAGGEWRGEEALALVRRITQSARRAMLVFAGAGACDVIDAAVRELKLPPRRVLGSAPEALAAGARAVVALAADASPADVSLTVLGIPPAQIVVPWTDASIGGFALARRIDEPTRRQLERRISALWPPGPHALAAAAAKAIASLAGRSRRLTTCFAAPDSSDGMKRRTAAVPVRLGPAGIVDVVQPALSVVEQVALDNAVML